MDYGKCPKILNIQYIFCLNFTFCAVVDLFDSFLALAEYYWKFDSFLDLAEYYWKFAKGSAHNAAPLHALLAHQGMHVSAVKPIFNMESIIH